MDQMREKIRQDAMAETQRASKKKDDEEITDDWTAEQSQLLIKAVNLFPAGTASRYNSCLWRRLKDGAYYCYCAYVLRNPRYSDFLSPMVTNTGIFLHGLKLSGESRS